MQTNRWLIGSFGAASVALLLFSPASAQTAKHPEAASDGFPDIVVTARKRNERLMDVPVAVSALSGETLQRYATSTLAAIAQQTPQLIIGEATTQTGGTVNLRGIGAGQSNAATDNPVSINLDGIQVSQGNVLRLGQYDIERVEVLKGPQTLFFGKNSPGGVISLVSNDPGRTFEAQLRTGYEFGATQRFAEAILSGPLGGGFSARIVGYISKQDGWFRNIAVPVPGVVFGTDPAGGPANREMFGRATLTYASPDERFSARLKVSGGSVRRPNGTTVNSQRYVCTNGVPVYSVTVTDCKLDRFYAGSRLSPAMVATDPASFGDGNPFFHSSQLLGSLDLKFKPSDQVSIAAVTGYYRGHEDFLDSFSQAERPRIASRSDLRNRQFTQEVRFSSEFNGPFNFFMGGFYQDSTFSDRIPLVFDAGILAPVAVRVPIRDFSIGTKAYSAFGQMRFKLTSEIELAGGLRYSHERKSLDGTVGGAAFVVARPTRAFHNVSPEASITYKPDQNLTFYASYRQGFVSGGYNATALQPVGATIDPSFDQSTVRGGEAGIKGYAADRQLRFDLTGYYYWYRGLQLSAFDPATLALTTRNAASAKGRGVELNIFYRPHALGGLELHSGAAYNNATYGSYVGGCYGGQTISLGCNLNPNAAGVFSSQDLSGQRLVRAPLWTFNAGVTYDHEIGGGLSGAVSLDTSYTSSYQPQLEADPRALQLGFGLLNGSISVRDLNDGWQVALIGKNLTQKYAVSSSFAGTLTGSGTGTASGVLSDINGSLIAPRAVLLQLTLRSSLLSR